MSLAPFFPQKSLCMSRNRIFFGCQMVKIRPQNKNHFTVCCNESTLSIVLLSDLLQEGLRKQLCCLNGQLSPGWHFVKEDCRSAHHFVITFIDNFSRKITCVSFEGQQSQGGGVFDKFKERQSKRVYKLMNFCIWLSNSTIQKLGSGSQIFPIMNFECGHKKLTIKLTQDATTSY